MKRTLLVSLTPRTMTPLDWHFDWTDAALVVANLATLGLVLSGGLSAAQVLVAYWWQSVLIGGFTVLTILFNSMKLNHQPPKPQIQILVYGIVLSFFFSIHYGGFHAVYALFLGAFFGKNLDVFTSPAILPIVLVFLVNHALSFLWYTVLRTPKETEWSAETGKDFFSPYARIIPMHIAIVLGGIFYSIGGGIVLLTIFILIKTLIDLAAHKFEHAVKTK